MPRLTISLLGPPLAEIDGATIEVDTRKATALLAYLVVTQQPHRRDSLAGLLWPEHDPDRARAALRRTLSTLKAALGGAWLNATRETVSLGARESGWTSTSSAPCSRSAMTMGTRNDHGRASSEGCPACLPPLTKAVGLYRDDFLAGFGLRDSVNFDDWQFIESEQLRREFAGALDQLSAGHAGRGEHAQAIELGQRRVALDHLHEPAHRHLVQLYARSDQRASGIRQYRKCVRILDEELGVPPLEETTELYAAIKQGASAPAAQPASPAPVAAAHIYPLVGRATEWKQLLEAYADVGPAGRLLVLTGELGIGMTRLGEELLEHARSRGAVTAGVRCFEGESSLAYGPTIEMLRSALGQGDLAAVPAGSLPEVSRLLPELGDPSSTSLNSLGAQARFFEALVDALLAAMGSERPGVVFLDDVHWADEASLEVLAYLVRRLEGRPIFILMSRRGSCRPSSPSALDGGRTDGLRAGCHGLASHAV